MFSLSCTDFHAVTKRSKTPQNVSLGLKGVDQERSLRKILMRFNALTCALMASVHSALHCSSCRNRTVGNVPKYEFGVQWGGSVAFVEKQLRHDFVAQTCALIAPVQPILHQLSCSNETV
jgi:hypothetical protein